jgi:hypothetical protein
LLQKLTHQIIVHLRHHTSSGAPLHGASALLLNKPNLKMAGDATLSKPAQNNNGLFAVMSQLAWEKDINLTATAPSLQHQHADDQQQSMLQRQLQWPTMTYR